MLFNISGVEIVYDLYNPTIQKIEVLRLEKRLDDELFYLRDAPQEFSTFPFDMDTVTVPPNTPVPVNSMKVICFFRLLNIYLDVRPRVDNQTSGNFLQKLTRPLVGKSPSASYSPKPPMGIRAILNYLVVIDFY